MQHQSRPQKGQMLVQFYENLQKVAQQKKQPQIMRNPIISALGRQKFNRPLRN